MSNKYIKYIGHNYYYNNEFIGKFTGKEYQDGTKDGVVSNIVNINGKKQEKYEMIFIKTDNQSFYIKDNKTYDQYTDNEIDIGISEIMIGCMLNYWPINSYDRVIKVNGEDAFK